MACQLGMPLEATLELQHTGNTAEYDTILMYSKLPQSLYMEPTLPRMMIKRDDPEAPWFMSLDEIGNCAYHHTIQEYIFKLNDIGYTYEQLAEFLEITFGDLEDDS